MSVAVHPDADRFLRQETAFRLGTLLTESPHPRTMTLSETLRADIAAGVRQILSVDEDIAPAAQRVMRGEEFARLCRSIAATLRRGRRIYFTGCGATGRLSILLEAMWRTHWRADAARQDQVRSVMAGGDFALIKSVEGFEDFPTFGRRQLRDTGVAAGDLVVAVTEGGETPFVIGTAWEALNAGAEAFFVFNNPADLLQQRVERSRQVIDEPRIVKLDLTTGPMAVTGSTRMQATTSELLVLGAAMEMALAELRGGLAMPVEEYVQHFEAIRAALGAADGVAELARRVELEESIYARHGRVTYLTDAALLDILTDTTERSPTFMIPPFRMDGDTVSPASWAFVKHPLLPTPQAWEAMLARPIRAVNWSADDYARMDAPEAIRRRPPDLSVDAIRRFRIGREPDDSRTAVDSALILILTPSDAARETKLLAAFDMQRPLYRCHEIWWLPVAVPDSPLRLWKHLAIKLAMNTVSTATMGRLGRLRGNSMVWVSPTNKKLIDRGTRLVAQHTGLNYEAACHALHHAIDVVRAMQERGLEAPSPVALAIDTYLKERDGRSPTD